jgi:molecular chaperone DnaJ
VSSSQNYYEILGIPNDADDDTIRKAYKKVVFECHPDRNPSKENGDRFIQATEAYKTLIDENKRQAYNISLHKPKIVADALHDFIKDVKDTAKNSRLDPGNIYYEVKFHSRTKRNAGSSPPFDFSSTETDDIEEPGKDVEVKLDISLEEAVFGCIKEVMSESKYFTVCRTCKGDRCRPGTFKMPCQSCAGTGRQAKFGFDGPLKIGKCPSCRGFGDLPLVPCIVCEGSGKVKIKRQVKVRVPIGVDTGHKLRLAGMGSPGINSAPGDLYVEIMVMSHDKFKRFGRDLHTIERIDLIKAINGGQVQIEDLTGSLISVDIPPGIQSGETVIVNGAGVRNLLNSNRGDLHISFEVLLPKNLTPRAKKLLEELEIEFLKTK